MERRVSGIDKLLNLFLAEDRREVMGLLRIGSFGDAPSLLEPLDVEEPQSCQTTRNGAW
jgi:hypothetical protein